MSTRVTITLPSTLIPPTVDGDAALDWTREALRLDHPGVAFSVRLHDAPARADFTIYEDTPDEQIADGLDDIEREAAEALTVACGWGVVLEMAAS